MENRAPRFVEETRETVDRWKERIAKVDASRLKFEARHGQLVSAYHQMIDEVAGSRKRRQFVTEYDLERGKVPITAWNRFAAIPGPSPEWFKTKTRWNTSADIGRYVHHSNKFITLDFQITRAGKPNTRRGNTFTTLGWPIGSVD